ncbi:MAG: CHASE2 domain-containing protein, partial [Verrucomicrobiota bacterium]|nr:CHASE2 domain-containing protein [Verrucomicrobiota bacterium]
AITGLLLAFLLLLGLFLVRESRQAPADIVDNTFVDWLAANTPRIMPPAPITLVEINDSSLENQRAWPWSPLDFSLFLRGALRFKPAVVAVEQLLVWENTIAANNDWPQKYPQYLQILHDYILQSPKILLAAQLGFPEDPDVIPPLETVPILYKVQGDVKNIPEFTIVEHQPVEELRLGSTIGFTNLPETSGTVRKVPLLFRYRGQIVPSFVLQAAMLSSKLTPDEMVVELGTQIWLGNRQTIPIDANGSMAVDFGSPFTRFGFDDLLVAVAQVEGGRPPAIAPDSMRGKLVMLARTDKVAQTLDLPNGRKGSPGELTAAALATIENQTFIRRISYKCDFAIIAVAMMLGIFFLRWNREKVVLTALSLLVLYVFACMTVFGRTLIWMPMLLPFGLMAFLVVFRLFTADSKDQPAGTSQ